MNKLLNDPQAIGATFAAMIGAGMLVRSISYEHSPMPKHLAWALHAGTDEARAALTSRGHCGLIMFLCVQV